MLDITLLEMDKSEWAEQLEDCWRVVRRSPWRMADLVLYGLQHYTDGSKDSREALLLEMAEQLEVSDKTLSNYARVAEAFEQDERIDALTISHHETVIRVKDKDERHRWLVLAAERGWTVQRLRVEVGSGGDGEVPTPLPNLVAVERELHRAGVKAKLGTRKARFEVGAGTLVLESDADLRWSIE